MGIINSWLGGLGDVTRDALDLGYNRKYIYRMSSFGSEPRWLGQSIATSLLLMQIFLPIVFFRLIGGPLGFMFFLCFPGGNSVIVRVLSLTFRWCCTN
jgi:hypothetical protein